jgi:hypothetical protein
VFYFNSFFFVLSNLRFIRLDISPAAMREWIEFLAKKDSKSNFAGLEQVAVLATGEVRWLCPEHAASFKTHYSF